MGSRAVTVVAVSEAAFTAQVLDLARVLGWTSLHIRPGRTAHGSWRTPVQGDGAGWPDLLLARPRRLIAAELKSARGRVAPEQQAWLDLLAGCGVETHVWRPADFDAITVVLARAPVARRGSATPAGLPEVDEQRHQDHETHGQGDAPGEVTGVRTVRRAQRHEPRTLNGHSPTLLPQGLRRRETVQGSMGGLA